MNQQTRQFYTRYRLYTSIAPAYLTGMLVFITGWFTYNPTDGPFGKSIEIVAGLMFFLACTGGSEVCSRLGFKLFKLQGYRAKLTTEIKQLLDTIFKGEAGAGQGMHPTVVELGEVPMCMVGGDVPGQLWLSTHTLMNTPASAMQHLLAHERAHLDSDTMLDRVLVTGGYWWICGVGIMMLVSKPVLALLWLLVASGIFLHVNTLRRARLERRADRLAVEATTLEGYSRALAKHLGQFEAEGNNDLVRGRLKRMGLSIEKVNGLIAENAADPKVKG